MNYIYLFGGIASLMFGGGLTIYQIRIFAKGKQDKFGGDIKLFGGSIGFIILGIVLLSKYS